MNKKTLTMSLMVMFFFITTAFLLASFSGSKDYRSRASGDITGVYGRLPPPTTKKPQFKVVFNQSSTCAQLCLNNLGKCVGVGTDGQATNGLIMTYSNASLCYTRSGNCTSTPTKLNQTVAKCSGNTAEWTNCRCEINQYITP